MKKIIFNSMKTTKFFTLLSLAFISFFTSCVNDDDYDVPSIEFEEPNITVNKSISEIQSLYNSEGQTVLSITDDLIIEGYVISNDEAGNFYKELVIQDLPENPTAGIRIRIDDGALYALYKPGRKVYVKLKGLAINDYNGVYQIGIATASSVDRLPSVNYTDYILRSNEVATITPKVITPSEYGSTPIDVLVQIDNMQVSADELGEPYAVTETTTNRTLVSCDDDSEIILRNSGYAGFSSATMPQGQGSIVAVFSQYSSTKQLFIRDTTDLTFTEDRCDDGGNGGENTECTFTLSTEDLPFTENWSSYGSSPNYEDIVSPWISYWQTGDREFSIRNYSGTNYAQMSGYNSTPNGIAFKAWLISPKVNIGNATQKTISFKMADAYSNGNPLKLYYSTDFDGSDCPQNFTWTEIGQSEIASLNANSGNYDNIYESTGDIDVSAISGEATFAFVYEGADNGTTTTIQLSEISIGGESEGGETIPPSENAVLAFAGSDFEDFTTFEAGLNSFGLQSYATQSAGNGIDGSAALSINTTGASGNDYVFTATAYDGLPSTYSRITFFMKGTTTGKSVSINLYDSSGSYYKFNLGSITEDTIITAASSNQYSGSIDTAGEWVQITLDLTGITDLNTTSFSDSFFALKIGKEAPFDLLFDNFTIE